MAIHEINGIANYVLFLRENPQEIVLLFHELLIGVTNFFRDSEYWKYLKDSTLPELLTAYPEGSVFRAWVTGCSTGEEAYTLAISFKEAERTLQLADHYSLQIFATDINHEAIEKARQGLYPKSIEADLSDELIERYFVQDNGHFRVKKEIREMVVFATQNLIMDPPFTKLDILLCRNLLIYMGPELQKKILPLLHYSLKPNGILMLGSSESIGDFGNLFTPINKKLRLYRRSVLPLRAPDIDFPARRFNSKNEIIMNQKSKLSSDNIETLANQILLEKFTPAAIFVTDAGDLIYINGHTGKYLEPPSGKTNWNIHAMAREGLRQEMKPSPKSRRQFKRPYYAVILS